MSGLKISRKDKNALNASLRTLPTYWEKPGRAITHIAGLLEEKDIQICDTISFQDSLPTYRETFSLKQKEEVDNMLYFAWHIMPSGRYEINSYIT